MEVDLKQLADNPEKGADCGGTFNLMALSIHRNPLIQIKAAKLPYFQGRESDSYTVPLERVGNACCPVCGVLRRVMGTDVEWSEGAPAQKPGPERHCRVRPRSSGES